MSRDAAGGSAFSRTRVAPPRPWHRQAATDRLDSTVVATRRPIPGHVLVALVDDVAARTSTARISLRLLFEATSAELTSYLSRLVDVTVVDEVLVHTYAQVWRLAGERPHEVSAENWLTAVALATVRDTAPGGRTAR